MGNINNIHSVVFINTVIITRSRNYVLQINETLFIVLVKLKKKNKIVRSGLNLHR